MLLSFLILVTIGTSLLLLPEMTTCGISFIDALFTSTSASCVTGLSVLSTGHDFTFKGQVVIMLLMQLGGVSILTFATFFSTFFSGNKIGLRYQHLVQDLLSTDKASDSFRLLKSIFSFTILIEVVGCVLLFACWHGHCAFDSTGEVFFYSLFHTIAAFNSAGFSLWDDNLMDITIHNSYLPQTIIMILVLIGGLGFMVLTDLFNPKFIKMRREQKWRKLLPGTKIVLYTTSGIIFFGTLIFFLTEYDHSLAKSTSVFDKFYQSLFQVVASRTAGFNTLDINTIAIPGLLLFMLMMFIGASPGSTGGGIKTTTFFVLIKSVIATIRGNKRIEFQKRTIPFEIVDRSYSIVIMSLMLIFLSCFALAIFEPSVAFLDIVFESVSAFSTSGLSTGCLVDFGWQGKLILAFNMYIGRIGTLTMAFAISKRIKESPHTYPYTYFMVG
jgi:potassium uptake TrkH family protein